MLGEFTTTYNLKPTTYNLKPNTCTPMTHLHDDKIKFLEEKALEVRKSIIEALVEAKSGHTAGPQ